MTEPRDGAPEEPLEPIDGDIDDIDDELVDDGIGERPDDADVDTIEAELLGGDRGDRGGRGGHRRLRGCRPRDRRRSGRPCRGRAADVGGQASERHHDRGQSSTVAIRDRGPCQGRRFEMVRHRDGRRLRPHIAERHPAGEWGSSASAADPDPVGEPGARVEREPERFGEPEWFGQPERGPSAAPSATPAASASPSAS